MCITVCVYGGMYVCVVHMWGVCGCVYVVYYMKVQCICGEMCKKSIYGCVGCTCVYVCMYVYIWGHSIYVGKYVHGRVYGSVCVYVGCVFIWGVS